MDKETQNIKEKIEEGRFEHGFASAISCTKEENLEYNKMLKEGQKLPYGVYPYTDFDGDMTGEYYTVRNADISENEKMEYLAYKKISILTTIRNCVIALLALVFVLLIVSLVILLKTSSIYNDIEEVKDGVSKFSYDIGRLFR